MRNIDTSKEQLIDKSGSMHRRVAELAQLEAKVFSADNFLGKASDFSNMRSAIKELT